MEIEQSASINEKSDKEIANKNEESKEKNKKRNREYQRAWRQRQKDLKKKVSKEHKEEKIKRHCEIQRAYYQRTKQCLKENVQLEQNQFLTQRLHKYEESHECTTPEVILHRNTDIPRDNNCLFHSLIRVLHLQISTCDLRRQLRDSPYLNSCHNPQEAYNILSSNNEYGDLDCLYLFGKIYNQNICVHYQYFNKILKMEDLGFCYLKANDTHNWIHLGLHEMHFTPYFSDDEKKKEDERKQKQKKKESSKRYRDKKRTSNLQTGPSTGGVPYGDEKVSKEHKEEKIKRHREIQRAYYQRTKQCLKENVQLEQNQFLTQRLHKYEESYECTTPEVILHRNTDIPRDNNCLFHSLIRVLHLQISTCHLRRQLRDSPYLNSCHNPQEAYNILSSNNEYGDLDCLYLFGKIYNQNICVHYQYFNKILKMEDLGFCYLKANDTHNWIHLGLHEMHFTPYFSDDEKKKEDERKQKQKNKEYSKRYRDKKRRSNLQTGQSATNVLDVQPVIHTSQVAGPSTGVSGQWSEKKQNTPYNHNMADLNDEETKTSQLITTELPSLMKIPKISVSNESPTLDLLPIEELIIKHELVDNLDSQETESIQNEIVQLPTLINTVKNEPSPSVEVVIKRETEDDDDETHREDNKTDRTKIILDNVLQNMFVAKDQIPTVSTSPPMTELPTPTDTTVNVKNKNSPEPPLTEEISIKIEPIDVLHDKETSRQNVIIETPLPVDTTVPVKDEAADDEEDYKIDLSKIMLHNVLQNMFVAKPQAPAAEEVSPSVEQPASLLRQLLATGQRDPIIAEPETASVENKPNEKPKNKNMIPAPVPTVQKTDGTEKKKRDNSNRPYKFQCAECGKKFRDKFFVRKHIESVHLKFLETCGVCNKSVGAYYLKHHMEMHKKGVYCVPCAKWFCLASYKAHMKNTMTHVKPEHYRFTCEECGMKFHRNVVLTRHINRVHLKQEKPHKCAQCPAAYEERRSLAAHVASAHERRERPRNFVCDHCGAAMYTKRNLVSHMVRHSGARPHKCKQCGAAFGYSGVLATHVKLKHAHTRGGTAGTRHAKDRVKKKRHTKDKGETSHNVGKSS